MIVKGILCNWQPLPINRLRDVEIAKLVAVDGQHAGKAEQAVDDGAQMTNTSATAAQPPEFSGEGWYILTIIHFITL